MSLEQATKTIQLTKSQLKQKIKENHEILRKKDLSSFTATKNSQLPCNLSSTTMDTISLRSTNSSDSGTVTAWEHVWTLSDSRSSVSHSPSPTSSTTSQRSRASSLERHDNLSITSSEFALKPPKKQNHVKHIRDACFLRSSYGFLATEPSEHRVQVFSNQRHTLLATISDNNKHSRLSESISFACGTNRFTPTNVSETDHEDVVAISSHNAVLYVRVDGSDTEVEAHTRLKDRALLRTLECISNERIMVTEVSGLFLRLMKGLSRNETLFQTVLFFKYFLSTLLVF